MVCRRGQWPASRSNLHRLVWSSRNTRRHTPYHTAMAPPSRTMAVLLIDDESSQAKKTADQIGESVVEAVQQQRFFVLPDHHQQSIIVQRAQDMNAFLEARLKGQL